MKLNDRKLIIIAGCLFGQLALANVDLHMHLTMEVPLSPFFQGHLNQTAVATDATSRLKSRVDAQTLKKSGLDLIVAVIYINPVWGDPQKQVTEQIQLLNIFCQNNPIWKIATEPEQAREFLRSGHRVFILSLEGGWIFQDQKIFEDLIFKHGIRIVTPMHFSDLYNAIGQPAQQKGLFGPIQKIINFFQHKSENALTPLGQQLISFLFKNKIWIDLSHASDRVQVAVIAQMPAGYPILFTHTVLQKYYGSDRGLDQNMLIKIKQSFGALGLLPSDEMLLNTPVDLNDCQKSNPFLTQWHEIENSIGHENLFLGSDLNAPIPTLSATPADKKCKPFMAQGLVSAADLFEVSELKKSKNGSDSEAILNLWNRVRK